MKTKVTVYLRFIQKTLGYGSEIGTSVYELACRGLETLDIHKPSNISYKAFAKQNLEIIEINVSHSTARSMGGLFGEL